MKQRLKIEKRKWNAEIKIKDQRKSEEDKN